MRRRFSRIWLLSAALIVLVPAAWFLARAWLHGSTHGLPYRDSFSSGKADEWKALGGT